MKRENPSCREFDGNRTALSREKHMTKQTIDDRIKKLSASLKSDPKNNIQFMISSNAALFTVAPNGNSLLVGMTKALWIQ